MRYLQKRFLCFAKMDKTFLKLVLFQSEFRSETFAGLAQLGEHMPYKHRVGGSSPSLRTRWFSSAGRAFALQARGRRFEPVNHHQWQVGTLHCASLPVFEEEIPRGKRSPSNESAQVVFGVKRRTSSQQEVLKSAGYITYVM